MSYRDIEEYAARLDRDAERYIAENAAEIVAAGERRMNFMAFFREEKRRMELQKGKEEDPASSEEALREDAARLNVSVTYLQNFRKDLRHLEELKESPKKYSKWIFILTVFIIFWIVYLCYELFSSLGILDLISQYQIDQNSTIDMKNLHGENLTGNLLHDEPGLIEQWDENSDIEDLDGYLGE